VAEDVARIPGHASIAEAWIKYHYLPGREQATSPLFDARIRLDGLVRGEPETAWRIIQEMWSFDQSEFILANIAAGPVEDLLSKHGPQFIERIEQLARRDPVFRKLLGAVWRCGMAKDVWDRIRAVAGPTF
jgi:hypothetical protein